MKSLSHLVLLAALAPAANSQSVIYKIVGNSTGDWFGISVSGAGDVNADGFGDVIIGAPLEDNKRGRARVISGADGSVMYTFYGGPYPSHFGRSVSGAGDVNGDGYADVIVGAPEDYKDGKRTGSARVFSGLDGSPIRRFKGQSDGDRFGYSVSGAGDVNGDGHADLIVGSLEDDNNGKDSGSARVFSGWDGSQLYTFDGDSPGDYFGTSVNGAGDMNADGYDDLVVGTDYTVEWARAFSGLDGSVLYTFYSDSPNDWFGYSVSGAGDVNGDGFDDVIIGAPWDKTKGPFSGSAHVFSGQDGSILYTLYNDTPNDWFGFSVSGAGDVNGDGHADLIVGAWYDSTIDERAGSAYVISGRDGRRLYTLRGSEYFGHLGVSVCGAGDVDGDGFADVIVGARNEDQNFGNARVLSGCDSLGTIYCTPAVPNSSGQAAVISACGSSLADGGYFMLHAKDLPINQIGYFLASQTQGFVANPGGSQGNLCLAGQIGRYAKQVRNSGPGGNLTIQVDLTSIPPAPPHTVLAGETWHFQAWFQDVGNTSNFTDAVSVLFK